MARKARVRSQSGIYRILLRSYKFIFCDDKDAEAFLDFLVRQKNDDFFEIYAYCLLNREIHLVVKEGLKGISADIMRICSGYVAYYNEKNSADGALFHGRFVSFPLEDDASVLRAVRQVHRMPLKENCKLDYAFSSYPVYFKKSDLLSSDAVILIAGSIIDFRIFCELGDGEENKRVLSDAELRGKIREMFAGVSAEELESLSDEQYNVLLGKIKKIDGATSESIARVLGIEKQVVEKA